LALIAAARAVKGRKETSISGIGCLHEIIPSSGLNLLK